VSKDYRYIFGVPILIHLIFVGIVLEEDETPKFYFSQKNYNETRRVLTNIGIRNGVLKLD
jgi:hypothetical protein